MLDWLRDEVIAVSRAADLRLRAATTLATEYAKGDISATEANKRFLDHSGRWGDALYGIVSPEGMTDEQILREIDGQRAARLPTYRQEIASDRPPSR